MLTTALPITESPINAQLVRLTTLCNPAIPPVIDREDLRARTTPLSPDILRGFCDFLDRQFPVESQALMAGMVHPKFTGEPLNYITQGPLNDDKLFIVGLSCTGAALAAYRACLPLFERDEISHETFREIVGSSWTYNSAKAFEIARGKGEVELVIQLRAAAPEFDAGFAKLIAETVKSTRGTDESDLASQVGARLKREIKIAAANLEYPPPGASQDEALRSSGISPPTAKWVKDFIKAKSDFDLRELPRFCEPLIEKAVTALSNSTLAFELSRAYSRSAYLDVADRLEAQGTVVDPRTLYILANARANTGHGSLGKFLLMFAEERPLQPEEFSALAQHLASDMTATNFPDGVTRLVHPLGKMDLQGFRGDVPENRGLPWMLTEGVMICRHNERGILIAKDIPDASRPPQSALAAVNYFALQATIGNACALVHARAIDPSLKDPKLAAEFMQTFLNQPMDDLKLINL